MKNLKQLFDKDWFVIMMAVVAVAVTIVSNYLYHGGRLVW